MTNVYVTAQPYLNVRSGKSTSYPVIGKLAYNALVVLVDPAADLPLVGVTSAWVQVKLVSGAVGYCSAGYLRKDNPPIVRATGFDVSRYQVTITGQKWKDSGASFVIARASYSYLNADLTYGGHIASARSAGLLCGAYHYLTAFRSGAEQARFFVDVAGAGLELGLWADVESAGLTEKIVREFCEECERLTGKKPGIYTRKTFWESYIGRQLAWASAHPLWVAHYITATQPAIPNSWQTWDIWQWAIKRPAFYAGYLDHNYYNGTKDDLWESVS